MATRLNGAHFVMYQNIDSLMHLKWILFNKIFFKYLVSLLMQIMAYQTHCSPEKGTQGYALVFVDL